MLKLGLGGVCLSAISPAIVLGQSDPASATPKAGDLLVKRDDPESRPLGPADVISNASPLMAWPMDPVSRTVRKANRLNQLLLIRLNPDAVLAYSALCTHAGCDITEWMLESATLGCDCHSSEFNAAANGRVVGGPAARPLPPLPLKIDGATLVVAQPFATSIRFDE